jgi:hypothetical protein
MHTPLRMGDNEFWYRVRGKRRRPRVIYQPTGDGDNPTRSSRPSEAAGSDRTEAKAGRKRAHGGREGSGEGPNAEPAAVQLLGNPATW